MLNDPMHSVEYNRAMAMVLLANSGSKLRDFAFQPNNHELKRGMDAFFKVKSEPPEEATTEDAQIAYIGVSTHVLSLPGRLLSVSTMIEASVDLKFYALQCARPGNGAGPLALYVAILQRVLPYEVQPLLVCLGTGDAHDCLARSGDLGTTELPESGF